MLGELYDGEFENFTRDNGLLCSDCKYNVGDGCQLVFEECQYGKANGKCPNENSAEEVAKRMSYADAVYNALKGKCVPYKKATKIKLTELLKIAKIIQQAKSNGSDYNMDIDRAYGIGQAEMQVEMMTKINKAKAQIINYMADEGFGSEYIDGVMSIINKHVERRNDV